MVFGKRRPADPPAAARPARPASTRGALARTAVAGLLLGFGGVTAGTSFVQASERGGLLDFFGQIFGAPRPAEIRPTPDFNRARKHYISLPDARRIAAERRRFTPRPAAAAAALPAPSLRMTPGRRSRMAAIAAPAPVVNGPLTVCVRTCDGYKFPLGVLPSQKDVPVHEAACAAACPGAPTALFTLPAGWTELDQAVSLKGQPYLAAAYANVYRQRQVQDCRCRPPDVALMPLPIAQDRTLRVGDAVAVPRGAEVVTQLSQSGPKTEDYRVSRSLGRGPRRDIETRIGAIRRDYEERAFRRALRVADPGTTRLRVAEARSTRIRLDGAKDAGAPPAAPVPGFTPVRVLVPSPFEQ